MSTVKFDQHLKTAFIFPYVLITLTLPVFMWENEQCIKKSKLEQDLCHNILQFLKLNVTLGQLTA